MRWKFIGASVAGTSHGGVPENCDDSHGIYQSSVCGNELTIFVVADGAGSAEYGKAGAQIACEVAGPILRELVIERNWVISDAEDLKIVASSIRAAIYRKAAELETAPRQLACTLLVAAFFDGKSLFAQCGDGAIVARYGTDFELIFWPDIGEYANCTNFVTDDRAIENFRFQIKQQVPYDLAVFTDGLQRIALDFSSQTVHLPFFENLFNHFRSSPGVAKELLEQQLESLLSSEQINNRTDDDKTLIIASLME